LPAQSAAPGVTLSGIGGTSEFVLVTIIIALMRDDGGLVQIRGEFASFTDPKALNMSVLGRDVLDNFDLIIGRHRNEILLLAPGIGTTLTGNDAVTVWQPYPSLTRASGMTF